MGQESTIDVIDAGEAGLTYGSSDCAEFA